MRLHFDPRQPHQLDAIAAVVDVLDGAPSRLSSPPGDPSRPVAQRLGLDDAALLANVQRVRARHGLPELAALEGHELTVEMETGTGKTYAYLRTLYELHARHGLSRFVIVVPGVAIREGVLQQLALTAEHLAGLYGGRAAQAAVLRPGRWSDLRRFAHDAGLQILVMNIDAFNKRASNLVHRPADALSGRRPIELLAACRPIVVLDEPQSLSGQRGQEAIASLAPLLTLRYSATHRRAPNLVYRLDPVRAHDLGLVKRIEVASVVADGDAGPPLEVRSIRATSTGVSARVTLDGRQGADLGRRTVTVRAGADLFEVSGEREALRGARVDEIDAGAQQVRLSTGHVLGVGDGPSPEHREAVVHAQLEETVRAHLDTELRVRRLLPPGEQLKVLSLCFVERVAHYADDDGVARRGFHAAWDTVRADPAYAELALPPADRVHAGYFARRRGEAVDTSGRSKHDEAAYELIMRDKVRLLDPAEPVRFVFSHSALREGWDNPNVFQICTLHPTRSELRKRQELGRGLRIPVLASGRRCFDLDVARLTVIANESYERFARALQTEVRNDFGVELGDRVVDRRARGRAKLREGWRDDAAFRALWERVGRRVRWCLELDPDALLAAATEALGALPTMAPTAELTITRGRVGADGRADGGGAVTLRRAVRPATPATLGCRHDPVAALQAETGLTRGTIRAVLGRSGLLPRLATEPAEALLEAAARALRACVDAQTLAHAVHEVAGPVAPEQLAHRDLADRATARWVPVRRSVLEAAPARSQAESALVARLDDDPETRTHLRWPRWHRLATAAGPFDPGWAVLRADGRIEAHRLARPSDRPAAVACGERALRALGVTLVPA